MCRQHLLFKAKTGEKNLPFLLSFDLGNPESESLPLLSSWYIYTKRISPFMVLVFDRFFLYFWPLKATKRVVREIYW